MNRVIDFAGLKSELHDIVDKSMYDEILALEKRGLPYKPYSVEVEIPPVNEDGRCSRGCPVRTSGAFACEYYCTMKLAQSMVDDGNLRPRPGPGCPRYKEGGTE